MSLATGIALSQVQTGGCGSCPGQSTRRLIKRLKQFIADQSGATSIEYALIAAGIALAIIAAVNSLGTTLSKKFTSINSSLK